MDKVGLWLKAIRAPFLQAAIIPVLLGTAVAYHDGSFYWGLFLLALIANVAVNAGTNLTNDYFDHQSQDDVINKNLTPFSGGSRVIQEGLLSPRAVLTGAYVCYSLALIIATYLMLTRGWLVMGIGLTGIILGYFYTATPFQLGYRGVGEILTGILLGPMSVLGAYFVQTQHLSWNALIASVPIGFLVAGILYINEFPDYEADKAVNKNHLVVLLGRAAAVKGYFIILTGIYLSIVVPTLLRLTPWFTLAALITLPIAGKAAKVAQVNYDDPKGIIPAMASTIMLHLTIGVLLSLGFIVDKWIF